MYRKKYILCQETRAQYGPKKFIIFSEENFQIFIIFYNISYLCIITPMRASQEPTLGH